MWPVPFVVRDLVYFVQVEPVTTEVHCSSTVPPTVLSFMSTLTSVALFIHAVTVYVVP